MPHLPDGWLVLDPSVQIESAKTIDALPEGATRITHHFAELDVVDLYNHWLGRVATAPETEALAELLEALTAPLAVDELREAFDERDIADPINALIRLGFVHSIATSTVDIDRARAAWLEAHARACRRTIEIDLDDARSDALASITGARDQRVVLRCGDAAAHTALLHRVRDGVRDGQVRVHSLTVSAGAIPHPDVSAVLLSIGATLYLKAAPWPQPRLDELRVGLLHTIVELSFDWSELDEAAIRACISWAQRVRVSGLRLRPRPSGAAVSVRDALRALEMLEQALGDVEVLGLPSDEVIVGSVIAPPAGDGSAFFDELLRAHLRRRVAAIRDLERVIGPPPGSEGDATLLDPADDLVSANPSLLDLRPGATVVDVCCSAGRTSRRLAPSVPGGLIIGVDRAPLLLDIGRTIDQDEGFTILQARRGLAQRLAFPDASVDAVVCDWAFNMLLSAGIADEAVREMSRILRPGGRLAIMQVLSRFSLAQLAAPHVFTAPGGGDLVAAIDACFGRCAETLHVLTRKLWATEERTGGRPTRWYSPAHLPRIVDQAAHAVTPIERRGLLCYSVIAERRTQV